MLRAEQFRWHLIISCEELKSFFLSAAPALLSNLSFSLLVSEWRFLRSLRLSLYRMALFLLKAGSPSWDISSLNQLWDLIDCTDFLVGLCAPKKWSPSFNALWIKQGRPVHSSLARLHNASTFVANKRLTRKERSDGRINLLEASPQVSHHFSCRMSSWIVTQKAKLSVREAVFFPFHSSSLSILFNVQRKQSVKRFRNTVRNKLCWRVERECVCSDDTACIQATTVRSSWLAERLNLSKSFGFRRNLDIVQGCFKEKSGSPTIYGASYIFVTAGYFISPIADDGKTTMFGI